MRRRRARRGRPRAGSGSGSTHRHPRLRARRVAAVRAGSRARGPAYRSIRGYAFPDRRSPRPPDLPRRWRGTAPRPRGRARSASPAGCSRTAGPYIGPTPVSGTSPADCRSARGDAADVRCRRSPACPTARAHRPAASRSRCGFRPPLSRALHRAPRRCRDAAASARAWSCPRWYARSGSAARPGDRICLLLARDHRTSSATDSPSAWSCGEPNFSRPL